MSAAERMSLVALFDLGRTLLQKVSQISFVTGKSGSLSQSNMKVMIYLRVPVSVLIFRGR